MDEQDRKTYWRDTKLQMFASIVPYFLAVLALPLYASGLNTKSVFGIPLGYFLLAHCLLFVAAVVTAGFVNRQDAIDDWHDAKEDH